MLSLTLDEKDFSSERIAIMIHDGGLNENEAYKETEKLIRKKRKEREKK